MSATASLKPHDQYFMSHHHKGSQRFNSSHKFNEKRRSLTSSILDHQKQKQKSVSHIIFNPEVKQKKAKGLNETQPLKEEEKIDNKSSQKNQDCPMNKSNFEFRLHDPESCVCEYCTCGRHLCNLHSTNKPKINHDSLYRRDYNRKAFLQQIVPVKHSESPSVQGRFTPMSTYGKDFYNMNRSVDSRFRPQNNIKEGGPFSGLTTYGNQFPNFKKQLVYPRGKNTGGQTVTNLPFVANSTYRKEFDSKKPSANPNEVKDNLKPGSLFLGNTTYNSNFFPHDEAYSSASWMNKQVVVNAPDYTHQYETTYRNDYLKNKSSVCRAKIELETRSGFYKNAKKSFMQNSDFKSMDPSFHSLSTSKVS